MRFLKSILRLFVACATASINYAAKANITITLASLGDGGYRESAGLDNTTNKYMDCLIGGSIRVGTVIADGSISILAYGSHDGGVIMSGGLIGTDETITWGTTPSTSSVEGFNQLKHLATISVDTTDDDNDIEFAGLSLAAAFGGSVPEDWGIVVLNETGVALHATQTNTEIHYQGIKYDSA